MALPVKGVLVDAFAIFENFLFLITVVWNPFILCQLWYCALMEACQLSFKTSFVWEENKGKERKNSQKFKFFFLLKQAKVLIDVPILVWPIILPQNKIVVSPRPDIIIWYWMVRSYGVNDIGDDDRCSGYICLSCIGWFMSFAM